MYLNVKDPQVRKSSLKLSSANKNSEENCLTARNSVEFSMPMDPDFTLVLILEYSIAEEKSHTGAKVIHIFSHHQTNIFLFPFNLVSNFFTFLKLLFLICCTINCHLLRTRGLYLIFSVTSLWFFTPDMFVSFFAMQHWLSGIFIDHFLDSVHHVCT